jgi:hypothetical protein
MSNAAAPVFIFDVLRCCDANDCDAGCLCDRLAVNVDVDELTAVEVAHFRATGTAAQRAEIAAYFAPIAKEIPMKSCKPYTNPDGCTLSATCPCSECVASRIPSGCSEGCDCLVCLVDGLSANPPPRVARATVKAA